MKKHFLLSILALTLAPAFADATLMFSNRNIDKADRSGTYHVPIWNPDGDPDTTTVDPARGGAGTLPGGVSVGLFFNGTQLRTQTGELVQIALRADANAQFFGSPNSMEAVVPGVAPGSTATLVVRAWQYGPSGATWNDAHSSGFRFGEWTFTTSPLGGTPPNGDLPIVPPTMTGWGPESGAGYDLVGAAAMTPEPRTPLLLAAGLAIFFLLKNRSLSTTRIDLT